MFTFFSEHFEEFSSVLIQNGIESWFVTLETVGKRLTTKSIWQQFRAFERLTQISSVSSYVNVKIMYVFHVLGHFKVSA